MTRPTHIFPNNSFRRTFSKPYFTGVSLLLATLLLSPSVSAACREMAKTELEQTYCAIKAKGKGSSLPMFSDFRKNPEKIQRLLLKKHAKQAGIPLPETTPSPMDTATTAPRQNRSTQPTPVPLTSKTERAPTPPQKPKTDTRATELNSCQLNQLTITCSFGRYRLQTNRPNRELTGDALSPANRLLLADRQSPHYRNASNLVYLSETYPLYIEKMLSIGLGDSTMSFTRYAATYEEIQVQNQNFSTRFNAMFELLKKEKANNSIQRRYDNSYPQNLSQCMSANAKLLICDNLNRNWVYLRET